MRAYVPELLAHGVNQDTFVAFIDGLNEAFVAHPVFEAVNIVSSVISIAVPLPDVQYAFGGLAIGAVAAGRVTSYARTKTYLKAINAKIFHPGGLHASIMSTTKTMEIIGCGEASLNLPALNTFADIEEEKLAEPLEEGTHVDKIHVDDPRWRRIKALEGFVMPLDFNVPEVVSPDTLFKRVGDRHVQWLSRRQQEKFMKRREKALDKYQAEQDKIEERRLKGDQEVSKLEYQLIREQEKFESKMNAAEILVNNRDQDKFRVDHGKRTAKIETQIEKEKRKTEEAIEKHQQDAAKKLGKPDEKESRIARKIRWVVISAWSGEDDEDNDLEKSLSNESEI